MNTGNEIVTAVCANITKFLVLFAHKAHHVGGVFLGKLPFVLKLLDQLFVSFFGNAVEVPFADHGLDHLRYARILTKPRLQMVLIPVAGLFGLKHVRQVGFPIRLIRFSYLAAPSTEDVVALLSTGFKSIAELFVDAGPQFLSFISVAKDHLKAYGPSRLCCFLQGVHHL